MRTFLILAISCILAGVYEGCSSSRRFSPPEPPPAESTPIGTGPEPSPYRSYAYRIVTADCNCAQYHVTEGRFGVEYTFQAQYRMDNGIVTEVTIDVRNNSRDTIFVDRAAAKVSSKNVQYTYNDKFLPLPILMIPPGESNTITLSGKERTGVNNWLEIAGEQFTVTLRGLRNLTATLPPQTVTFVPENPMFTK